MLELTRKEDLFFKAYLEAIDFTETGDINEPDPGEELDETFYREQLIDCLAFYNRIACYLSDDNIERAGHDFWLTRNGHGAGFWDRPEIYGEGFAKDFTELSESKAYGAVYPVWENWCEGMGCVDNS